jgi:hypothetical protein
MRPQTCPSPPAFEIAAANAPASERALFRRLAVFPGGATGGFALEAAEAVGAAGAGGPQGSVVGGDVGEEEAEGRGQLRQLVRETKSLPPAQRQVGWSRLQRASPTPGDEEARELMGRVEA